MDHSEPQRDGQRGGPAGGAGVVSVIVNPVSGSGRRRALLDALCRRFEAAGLTRNVLETRGRGDARRLAEEIRAAGRCRAVVAAGGDGTMGEVASGLGVDGPPILVFPAGTENILAKYLGTVADDAWLWDVFDHGRTVRFDLGVMNDRTFLLVAGVGFDAYVVRRLETRRRGHISYLSYVGPVRRAMWRYAFPSVAVEADGEVVHDGPGLVFVGNVPRYALGLAVVGAAAPDDGLLDLCVFRCASRTRLLRHAVRVLLRRHLRSRDVVYRRAREIRVSSEHRVDVELDGDWACELPATFGIRPRAAAFLVSADWRPRPALGQLCTIGSMTRPMG